MLRRRNDVFEWPRDCETCDGYGEICTMRGQTVDDDEFTLCPDCEGTGIAHSQATRRT